MGFRGIERATGVCHNTVINWVKQAQKAIAEEDYEIPETTQLDELQTFVGSKKTSSGFGLPSTAINQVFSNGSVATEV